MATGSVGIPRRSAKTARLDNVYGHIFTPRIYQIALLEAALCRSTIVCLGSSSAKTFLTVMLTKELAHQLRRGCTGKRHHTFVFFDSDLCVQLSARLLGLHTDLNVAACTSKSYDDWRAALSGQQVIVTTADAFLGAVSLGILSDSRINLAVFDDCHLSADSDHSYNRVINFFDDCCTGDVRFPHVLGLTSSILANITTPAELEQRLERIESALRSTAEMASDSVMVDRYGTRPRESLFKCEPYVDSTGLIDSIGQLLNSTIDFIDDLNPDFKAPDDFKSTARLVLTETLRILRELGPWCAARIAAAFIHQLMKQEKPTSDLRQMLLRISATVLRSVEKRVDIAFDRQVQTLEDFGTFISPRAARLVDVIRESKPDDSFTIMSGDGDLSDSDACDTDDSLDDISDGEPAPAIVTIPNKKGGKKGGQRGTTVEKSSGGSGSQHYVAVRRAICEVGASIVEEEGICGIIFVEHRYTAFTLNKLIVELCNWDPDLYFVRSHYVAGCVASTSEAQRQKQENILRKFRQRENKEINVLVATSALEEGVDLPRCNLVVRFDPPSSYRSYMLSKGRARASNAKFCLLVDETFNAKFGDDLSTFKGIENILLGRCHNEDDHSSESVNEEDANSMLPAFCPLNEPGAPQVTMTTAIRFVNRYCAKLPSDAFTHLTPKCHVEPIVDADEQTTGQFKATIQLPINSPIKWPIVGDAMPGRRLAQMAAALKVCQVLHKFGELNNQLQPVGKEIFKYEDKDTEWDEQEMQGDARPGTTKCKQYYNKKVATVLLGRPQSDVACCLYRFTMTLTCPITEEQNTRGRPIHAPEDTPRGFGFLCERQIPQVPNFPVFTRSGEVTVSVDLVSADVMLTAAKLSCLNEFHRFVFCHVLRLEKMPMSFDPANAQTGNIVVPLVHDEAGNIVVDWEFIALIETSPLATSIHNVHHPANHERRSAASRAENHVSKNPAPLRKEPFVFDESIFADAVVMPSYRNVDQPQYFYVAEIRHDLTPRSAFPSPELYDTFEHYYKCKYNLALTSLTQPLLDVDHTSARLNLLTPRYVNQKGVALPTSSATTRRAKRENLQQKQILVPELCDVHPFPASLWRKAVCLPAILYRTNCLLVAEELRAKIAVEARIGDDSATLHFPPLRFEATLPAVEGPQPNCVETASNEASSSQTVDQNGFCDKMHVNGIDAVHVGGNSCEDMNGRVDSLDNGEPQVPLAVPDGMKNRCCACGTYYSENVTMEKLSDIPNNKMDSSPLHCRCRKIVCNGDMKEAEDVAEKMDACSLVDKAVHAGGSDADFISHSEVVCNGYSNADGATGILNGIGDAKDILNGTAATGISNGSDSILENGKSAAIGAIDVAENAGDGADAAPCSRQPFSLDADTSFEGGPTPCDIIQTLTMSNANDFFNLERLETIGDSFLKFAITIYLYCTYPGIHEGKLSYLRSIWVSNRKLCQLGKSKKLPECMVAVKFEPSENWLPPGYMIKQPDSSLAARHSALQSMSDPDPDLTALSALMSDVRETTANASEQQLQFNRELEELSRIVEEEDGINGAEAASDGSNATASTIAHSLLAATPYSLHMQHSLPDKSIADCVEALIGCYLSACGRRAALRFMDWLGLRVLPHRPADGPSGAGLEVDDVGSLAAPSSPLLDYYPDASRELEFQLDGYDAFEENIGYRFRDRSYLLQAFTHASYHYNRITDCYQRLEFLGDAILDYIITRHLFEDSKKHSPGVLTDLRSALVNNNIFACLAVQWNFHKYFKAISPQLFNVVEKFVLWQMDHDHLVILDEEMEFAGENGEEDIEIPKALGDIFESVAGAIYLDSGMSLDTVWHVYYRMMKPHIDAFLEKIPKSPVRELLEMEPETAKFEKPERTIDGKIRVSVNVVGKGNFSGVGRNYRIAKSAAAKRALRCIKSMLPSEMQQYQGYQGFMM